MLNKIQNKEQLLIIKDLIEYAQKKGIDKVFLEQVLTELLPSNNGISLMNYKILNKGYMTALFDPNTERILISMNKLNQWLDMNSNDLNKVYKIDDLNEFKIFLTLFAIVHEIEHAKQFLIGKDLITAPNQLIRNGYKGLFELFRADDSIIPRPIKNTRRFISLMLYKVKQNYYVLERNANVESTELLKQLSLYMNKEDIFDIFDDFKTNFLKIGYIKNNIGSLEETYHNIFMYDKYIKFYENLNISEENKIRYGLKVSEETRIKILENKLNKTIY